MGNKHNKHLFKVGIQCWMPLFFWWRWSQPLIPILSGNTIQQIQPKKFHVQFFKLACTTTYSILHVDVYQGWNSANIGILDELKDLPTTRKSAMNAIMSAFGVDRCSARHVALDNRYQCPKLAALLLANCNMYSTGTCRQNHKG